MSRFDGCISAAHRGRFNMVSSNGTPEELWDALGHRLEPLGWQIQIYAEGDKLMGIVPRLAH